jgi:DNA-directed RNA polymerase subunit K
MVESTKYEIARIIGARALQISMGAPFLINLTEQDLESLHYNPIEIAKKEFEKDLIPIIVKRRVPKTSDRPRSAPIGISVAIEHEPDEDSSKSEI